MASDGKITQDEIDRLLSGNPLEEKHNAEKEKVEERRKRIAAAKEKIEARKKCIDAIQDSLEKLKAAGIKPENCNSRKEDTLEVLNQNEIDDLLNCIANGSSEKSEQSKDSRRIKIYDFNRPDRFSKEQIRFFQNAFEEVTRLLSCRLTNLLQTFVTLHVASVDQLTYEEFIRSIPTPTTVCITNWNVEDCKTKVDNNYYTVFEIDPWVTAQILHGKAISEINEKYFKDSKEKVSASYSTTEISFFESEIMRKEIFPIFHEIFTECINKAGEKARSYTGYVLDGKSQIYELKTPGAENYQILTCPQFASAVSPTEMVLLVTVEANMDDESQMINFCLPYPFIRDILIKGKILMTTSTNTNLSFGLQVMPGNSAVCLGQFNMQDGAKISEGLIIQLDKYAGEPVDLVNKETGKVFAKGEVVVIDENFGVRVTEVLDKSLEEPKAKSGNAAN